MTEYKEKNKKARAGGGTNRSTCFEKTGNVAHH